MTCLTSPPENTNIAFMDADIVADMKAPPVPRRERAATTAAVVQDQPEVDLATSTFRPTVHPVLAGLTQTRMKLAELQAPIVEELRATLQHLHEVKSLGSTAENARAAATVYHLAKRCGMDLTYQEEPVALVFSKAEQYTTGCFRLRTFSAPRQFVYTGTAFPLLGLIPSDPTAHTSDKLAC